MLDDYEQKNGVIALQRIRAQDIPVFSKLCAIERGATEGGFIFNGTPVSIQNITRTNIFGITHQFEIVNPADLDLVDREVGEFELGHVSSGLTMKGLHYGLYIDFKFTSQDINVIRQEYNIY